MFCDSACRRLLCCEHLSCSSLSRLQTLCRLPPPSSSSSVSVQLATGIRNHQIPRSASLYLRVGSCPSLPTTYPFFSTTSSSLEASSLPPLGSDLSAVSFSFHVLDELPKWLSGKNLPANAGDARDEGSVPGPGRSPGVGNGNPLQYYCLQKSHGQRSLVGYSPWGRKESDTTE